MSSLFPRSRLVAAVFPFACASAWAAPLAGIVQTADGKPAAGALVVAADDSDRQDANGAPHRWITTSDVAGRYAFADFPTGSCQVTANAGAAGVGQANCKPADGAAAADVVITVKPAANAVGGRVVRPAKSAPTSDDLVLVTLMNDTDAAPVVYGTLVVGDTWSIALPAGSWSSRAVTPQAASSKTYFVLPVRKKPITFDLAHPHGTNPALARELAAMAEKDQEVRRAFMAAGKDDDETRKPMERVDDAILARLKQIIRQHGWPTAEQVGSGGVYDLWLLAQHAPGNFIAKALPQLRKAADRGEIAWANVAVMIDRDLMDRGQPQIYGSQVQIEDGHFAPAPMRDPEHVDERRAEVGLGPLAEYLGRFEKKSPAAP